MLARMSVDWAADRCDANELDGLVGSQLQILQSLVLDPKPKRSRAELRMFVRRWVAPAARATARPA